MSNCDHSSELPHKGMLFINDDGYSLHFVIRIRDVREQDNLVKKLKDHAACAFTDFNDIGPHSIVLTDDPAHKHEKVEVFKIGYIYDCLQQTRILDISDYRWSGSTIYRVKLDYMDVVYYRKCTWDEIPEKYYVPREENSSSDDDYSPNFENVSSSTVNKLNIDKKTRTPYSRKEKEAILQYIVSRNLYLRLKGVRIWQEMEMSNICPIRTWQSMKEHFLKSISKEINCFSTLTPKQKQRLRDALK